MKSILTLLLAVSIIACNNSKTTNKETTDTPASSAKELVFDKMLGTWQNEDGKSYERWVKNDNGTYNSSAFSIKGTDTSWNEQASIYSENNSWVFENIVTGQNDGKAVKFTSSLLNDSTVQFSNPAHDFPTDINYTVTDANTLKAFIVGPNSQGGKDTIPFNYIRVK